ncbi:MAG TPA: endopeptidase La [Patescibacteria group bacterium]|nr:endopeptidase La [Patescibacteria group bacterium]
MKTILSLTRDKKYPIIPIRNGVVFPDTESVLVFGRQRSIAAIENAFKSNSEAVVVMQKDPNINEPTPEDLYQLGTLIKIEKVIKNTVGTNKSELNALIHGIDRVRILSFESFEPFMLGVIANVAITAEDDDESRALVNHATSLLKRAVSVGKGMDFVSFMKITGGLKPTELANQVSSIIEAEPEERQKLLEQTDIKEQLKLVVHHLAAELRVLEIEKNIESKTQAKFDKHFRKTVLEERLKTIEKELGKSGEGREMKELTAKIKKANMPLYAEKKAREELKRLAQMSQYNPEASYLRSYLDWLVSMPWSASSPNNVDMKMAEKVLEQDHYGLKKIKERIIEYLAVMKLKSELEKKRAKKGEHESQPFHTNNGESPESDILHTYGNHLNETDDKSTPEYDQPSPKKSVSPTILCLVGPPGVGKTSIGRSIARSLGRKFVKISLGGVRDEAEIRGHRRTYVGALPGRIIQAIKTAGTNNPVFMLDEIDKLGTDFRGDPSASLLEALDPEQNYAFEDHYLEVPFDLSGVFFIATCNLLDTIPPALRDRLEVIRFPGYTEEEKFNIAKRYLVNKQRELHGLEDVSLKFTENALHYIIARYTREAGVRNLEREIASVMRKIARLIAEGKKQSGTIGISDIAKYLGPARFTSMLAEKKDDIGMVTGLAWTQAGGEIMFIEVALMPGKGNLLLTGQLGDVMKESCQAAMSFVRSKWKQQGLKRNFYESMDVHVHVPEGAVPKDGPSAGIAITTALVSALTKIPAKRFIAMTGEVTLRGRVLEIGGIKEKVIAAHRAGIKQIIMPMDNKKDLEEIPDKVKRDLTFHFVRDVSEVLKLALVHQTAANHAVSKRSNKKNGHPKHEPVTIPASAIAG